MISLAFIHNSGLKSLNLIPIELIKWCGTELLDLFNLLPEKVPSKSL